MTEEQHSQLGCIDGENGKIIVVRALRSPTALQPKDTLAVVFDTRSSHVAIARTWVGITVTTTDIINIIAAVVSASIPCLKLFGGHALDCFMIETGVSRADALVFPASTGHQKDCHKDHI